MSNNYTIAAIKQAQLNEPVDPSIADEMILPNHPHAAQRNWQPGDDDEAIPRGAITTEGAVRTLRRLLALTSVPAEELADALFPSPERLREMLREMGLTREFDPARIRPSVRIDQIVAAMLYLEKLAHCLDKKMQCKCAECGQDVWAKTDLVAQKREYRPGLRRDARYCSQACRQKAFRKRKRVTANTSNTKAKASRVTALPTRRAA